MSLIIIFCCASSTPVMAVVFSVLGAVLWRYRLHMRTLRWSLLIALVGLHLVMKAPVWHLISRIDLVSGNTGWHRYYLIDQAIHHFSDWWLIGTRTTAHWGWGLQDVTNQFILEGVRGGALRMGLFVAIIVLCFGCVGRLWRLQNGSVFRSVCAWALGVSLFVHAMNFVAVSYFGQIIVVWYLLLAAIVSLSTSARPKMSGAAAPAYRSPHSRSLKCTVISHDARAHCVEGGRA
jgi:hypothetical protein